VNPRSKRLLAAGSLLALAAGALSLAAVPAQEEAGPAPAAAADDPASLVEALGDPDFGVREKAHAALKEKGAAVREALEQGAKSEDAQVRWSAKRLLRLLDPGKAPRGRFLDFGEEREAGAFPTLRIGGDFDRAMEDLRRRMADLEKDFDRFPHRGFRFELQPGAGVRVERRAVTERDGERIEAAVDADGRVRVTLSRKGEPGAAKEESVEAESLDALAKEHPEVHAKVKDLLGDAKVRTWPEVGKETDRWTLLSPPRLPFLPRDSRVVLGIVVSEVPEVLRAHLAVLPAGEGLVVEEVLPKTLAGKAGLRRHDILRAVNGIPVSTAEDVRSAVEAVKEGGEIRLKILRAGRPEEVSGTR